MEIEEAIKICEDFIEENKDREIILHTAIQTIIENSIPKKKIKDNIKAYEKLIDDISESEQYSHEIPLYRHDIQVLQELLEDK